MSPVGFGGPRVLHHLREMIDRCGLERNLRVHKKNGFKFKRNKKMPLMLINLILVVSSILSVWIIRDVHGIIAIPCGIVGGLTIYSRVMAWKTGAAQHGYYLVSDSKYATKKMKNIEARFWGTGVFNLLVFLWYILKKFI